MAAPFCLLKNYNPRLIKNAFKSSRCCSVSVEILSIMASLSLSRKNSARVIEKAKQMEQDAIKEQTKSLSIQKNNYSEPTDSQINKKAIYTGVTIGGTAIAVTGFCLQKIGLASLGLVGAIIGGVLLFNDSKK